MKPYKFLLSIILVLLMLGVKAQDTAPYWSTTGNTNATTASKLGTTNAIPLRLLTKNTERMRIDTSGRIGIGTTAPGAPLDLRSTATGQLARFNGGSSKMYIGLYENSVQRGYIGSYTGNNADVDFGTNSANTTGFLHLTTKAVPRLTIDTLGKVGIGTGITATSAQFTINAAPNTYPLDVRIDGSRKLLMSKNGCLSLVGPDGMAAGSANGLYVAGNVSVGDPLFTYNVNYGSKLAVLGSAYFKNSVKVEQGSISCDNSAGNGGGLTAYGNSSNTMTGYGVYGQGYYGVYGSGTSYGVYGVSDNYAGYFLGSVYTTGNYLPSARKLKQNITNLSSAIAILLKLQPKEYEYKQEGSYKFMHLPQGKRYGFIAEDLEQVLPGLVKSTEFNMPDSQKAGKLIPDDTKSHVSEKIEFKAVNYLELIPIIIKGMQEQEAENESLKKQLQNLQQQLAELHDMVVDQKNSSLTSTNSPYLEQNVPNPASSTTTIRFRVPGRAASAKLVITDVKGQLVTVMSVSDKSNGQVDINTSLFAAGTYNYSLWMDGKQLETKRMAIVR